MLSGLKKLQNFKETFIIEKFLFFYNKYKRLHFKKGVDKLFNRQPLPKQTAELKTIVKKLLPHPHLHLMYYQ